MFIASFANRRKKKALADSELSKLVEDVIYSMKSARSENIELRELLRTHGIDSSHIRFAIDRHSEK